MSPARALRLLGEGVALVLALAASLGLFDALRSLPGPRLALALPLRETGHGDRVSILVVVAVPVVVFALAALLVDASPRHPRRTALWRAAGVLAGALALQAASLQLVLQASSGFDWAGALASPAPYVCALGALLGSLLAARRPLASSRAAVDA